MENLIVQCPINGLSFGNVGYNILREIYNRKLNVSLFPKNNSIDLSSFNKTDNELQNWLQSSVNKRNLSVKKDYPELNLWHLNGCEGRISNRSTLYTFHETSQSTKEEVNLCRLYDKVIFSSKYSRDIFRAAGVDNCEFIPIGFDQDFFETSKYKLSNKIHFGLMGKWENRKHTQKIIKLWAKLLGNNPDFLLTCCVTNPFMKKEELEQEKHKALGETDYENINFLPWMKTNGEVNQYLNSIDIDLGGLSGAEGWNLPSFNATCLGKWSIVLNHTAHKDWATKDNSILIEPSGTESIADGRFFFKDSEFNKGNRYCFSKNQFEDAINIAINKSKTKNEEGLKLKNKFTYKSTVDRIFNEALDL